MCIDAVVCNELSDDNDYSSCSVGDSDKGYRIMLSSGCGRAPRIEVEKWFENLQENKTIAEYYPNYCPNCGRKIEKRMYK